MDLLIESLLPLEIALRLRRDWTSELLKWDDVLFLIKLATILSATSLTFRVHSCLIMDVALSPKESLSKILMNSFIVISSAYSAFPVLDFVLVRAETNSMTCSRDMDNPKLMRFSARSLTSILPLLSTSQQANSSLPMTKSLFLSIYSSPWFFLFL